MERPPLPTPGTTLHLLRLLYLFGLLAAGGCESRQGPELGSGKAAFAARTITAWRYFILFLPCHQHLYNRCLPPVD
jgi:hypothetical protein